MYIRDFFCGITLQNNNLFSSWTQENYSNAAYPNNRGKKTMLSGYQIMTAVGLYIYGHTQQEIAVKLGASQATISRVLRNVWREIRAM